MDSGKDIQEIKLDDVGVIKQVIKNTADIENIKSDQIIQDKSIQRVEVKVDKILWGLFAVMFGVLVNIFKEPIANQLAVIINFFAEGGR